MAPTERTFDDVRKFAPKIAKAMQRITGKNLRFAVILWDTQSPRVCWLHDMGTEELLLPRLEGTVEAVKEEIEHRVRGIN